MSTSVLLPPARVDIYSTNQKTVDCANSLVRDWRFSRVALRVENKEIDKAITDYEQHVSPDLVIIETEDIGEALIDKLGQLAGNCVQDTEAIIVGPKNDVHLYRQLIGMGVKDYLVGPIEEKELSDVIAQILLDKKGLSESHIIAVIGSRGGVGTSTISHIVGSTLADKAGHKTLLLDAAGGWGTIAIPFGAETTTTLQEAIRQVQDGSKDDVDRLLYEDTDKLTLLPCGGDPLLSPASDEDGFENMLDEFMRTYPVIVVDLSAAERSLQNRVIKKAHDIIVVTSPLLPALRTCRSLIKEITERQSEKDKQPTLILNMEGVCNSHEVAKKDISSILEYEVSCCLPYDTKLFMGSEAKEQEISRNKSAGKTIQSLVDLVYKLLPESKAIEKNTSKDKEESGFLSKLLRK